MGFAGAVLRFFIIFNSNSGKDEPQTLHYAITQNCSMGADVRQGCRDGSQQFRFHCQDLRLGYSFLVRTVFFFFSFTV